MNKLFGRFAVIVMVASLIVHICTFFPELEMKMGLVAVLHVLAMLSFAPMVFVIQSYKTKYPEQFKGMDFWKNLKPYFSWQMRWFCHAVFLYVGVNFYLFMSQMQLGVTREVAPGKYELHNKGKFVRNLTQAEARRIDAMEVRGFSGHWIAFSLLPAVFFLWAAPRVERGGAAVEARKPG